MAEKRNLLFLNVVSYCVGWVFSIRFPSIIQPWVNRLFMALTGATLKDTGKSPKDFESISKLFIRELTKDARPVGGSVCSPADGMLTVGKEVIDGSLFQAKSHSYLASELVGEDDFRCRFGYTVYLAPKNYHRVHSPVSGELTKIVHFPGELWPVNQPFVKWVPRLFCRNERLVFKIETEFGPVFAVMVGAMNVGKITTPWVSSIVTNQLNGNQNSKIYAGPSGDGFGSVKAGDSLGVFHLGSTVVVLFSEEFCQRSSDKLRVCESPHSVVVGENLLAD